MKTQSKNQTLYFKHDGGSIAYDDNGAGPLVVCVPGMGEMRAEYRYLANDLLNAGFRVVTADVRGHGESSVGWNDYSVGAIGADIVALIRHLNAGPAILVSNSMAGGAAVWAYAEAPELFAAQVLTGPVVRDNPAMPAWAGSLLYTVLFAKPWGVAAWGRYYSTLYKSARPVDFDGYLKRLLGNLREPGRLAALRNMIMASKAASEARLRRFDVPAVIVMGTADPDFKDATAEAQFLADKTGATLDLVAGAGHYPHVELAAQVNPRIVAFCRQVAAPAAR